MQAFPDPPPPPTAAAGGRGRVRGGLDPGGRLGLAALLQPDQARLHRLGLLQARLEPPDRRPGLVAEGLGPLVALGHPAQHRPVGVPGHLGVLDQLGVAGHQHGGHLDPAGDQGRVAVEQGVGDGQAAGAVHGRGLAGQGRLGPVGLAVGGRELALVVGQLVLGPGQGGLGRLELGGGLLELGLEGPLAAAGVLQRGRLDGGDAGQQQGKHGKAEEDSAHRRQGPSVWGNGWRSATILGGATAYPAPAARTKSAGAGG